MISSDPKPLWLEFSQYGIVGAIAYMVDMGLLIGLTEWVHLHYLLSAGIAFLAGLGVNYLLSITWVFSVRRLKNKKLEFFLFSFIGIIGLGINEGVIWFATEKGGFHYVVSKIIATGVVFLWNFFARKYLLFYQENHG